MSNKNNSDRSVTKASDCRDSCNPIVDEPRLSTPEYTITKLMMYGVANAGETHTNLLSRFGIDALKVSSLSVVFVALRMPLRVIADVQGLYGQELTRIPAGAHEHS